MNREFPKSTVDKCLEFIMGRIDLFHIRNSLKWMLAKENQLNRISELYFNIYYVVA